MNVFELRKALIESYEQCVRSFINIRDDRIQEKVEQELGEGLLWPDPLLQLNPAYEAGEWIDGLAEEGILHEECGRIFRGGKDVEPAGKPLRLYRHQSEAIRLALQGQNCVLTTGTGSGKSLAYIIPIVDHVLRHGSGRGVQAIIVYPMNALANSQIGELEKFLCHGYPDGKGPVTFARYTGQESDEEKQRIVANSPDILLTNYVMLELILTRPQERSLIRAARGLRFLVLDELHTYRGRQGADVAMLARRTRDAMAAPDLQFVGTSATLAGPGSYDEQREEVARVGSMIFGAPVQPAHVIGETLRRTTPERDVDSQELIDDLKRRLSDPEAEPPSGYQAFVNDPLSVWVETTFGVKRDRESGRLLRVEPRSVWGRDGAARELSEFTGLPVERCGSAIEEQLLASYACEADPETSMPPFAFRLHQFVSRGDTVYASVEPEEERELTVHGQQYVPGDRSRMLFPLVFCRECGQEYYSVRMSSDPTTDSRRFLPRDPSDQADDDEEGEAGYLYVSTQNPWPSDPLDVMARLPDDWLEERDGTTVVRGIRRDYLPQELRISGAGVETPDGAECHYVGAPFRFCLNCGVSYGFRQRSDFAKLTTLGTEGRSTATTVLGLAAVHYLRREKSLRERARKLLSFTDNRQDASLQAGHFNDFIQVGLLRSAIFKAAKEAGDAGLSHDVLVQRVFEALDLPLELYASDPTVRFRALDETKAAFRSVLGYRLYHDLRRGWRITAPNLEQCGLLRIDYLSLDELSRAEDIWESLHSVLAQADADTRTRVCKTLLDYMRRGLAIKVDCLDAAVQERIQQRSSQRLIPPWAIDENERLETAAVLYPRPTRRGDYGGNIYLSARGGYGQYLRRTLSPSDGSGRLSLDETQIIICQLLEGLKVAGLVEVVREPQDEDQVPGYQLPAAALRWVAGDGSTPFHDPIRVPQTPQAGGQTNPFFVRFYTLVAAQTVAMEAREHTAQVPYEQRLEREERFRRGALPVLFCSPTMELGVDIAELNVVNMRNIPPTPANYAQRSGRAGRSGQPALVFSYCTTYSSHDQYYFKRPRQMVAGAVSPPRIDLTNEELIGAHVHAVWLAETGCPLGSSLKDVLDLAGHEPTLELQPHVRDSIASSAARRQAQERSGEVLDTIADELRAADWYTDGWLDEIIGQAPRQFERACDRWRGLYRAALKQRALQHSIIADASRSAQDKSRAKRLRAEAEAQLDLLTEAQSAIYSDFYSYRYFASEGFLPGYNFPRLPLSAFIPGRVRRTGRDEFLSRPRFLAISEFGPRAVVYHEGSRYVINKVILPVDEREEGEDVATMALKQCGACGYCHPITEGEGPDLCERCGHPLDAPLRRLFRLQNVSTKRRAKINCDEEERLRMGYEIQTGFRFAERGGVPSYYTAEVRLDGSPLATLTYGHAATIQRVNLGWARRADKDQYGFLLDIERGYWAKNTKDPEDADDDSDPMAQQVRRVVPYVEDRKNCLLFEPADDLPMNVMASLQAALKHAIQVDFQLEESELAAEPLPSRDDRNLILLYEASEGGAGVLRRLADDHEALGRVARLALELCHFDPDSGQDRRRAEGAREDCEAACYDCLMSYVNQPDHLLLDRHAVKDFLMRLMRAEVETSPAPRPRAGHLEQLMRQCQSDLERQWLQFLEDSDLRLPSKAQVFIDACHTRPDFLYEESLTAIYVDGHHHDYPERKARDETQTGQMEDQGYMVIRFGHTDDWEEIVRRYPNVFGRM